jgi:hypothetical protein
MANVRNGNTVYVDSTGDLTTTATRVYYIIMSATGGGAILVLQDAGANVNKMRLSHPNDKETHVFDFTARPLYFPGGVAVSTLTNCNATIVAEVQGG